MKLRGENAKLRAFAQKMLEGWPEDFGDVDGFTIQEAAVECGLLEGETRHEPCGEDCNCASYHGDMSGGVTCYRRTALLMGPNVEFSGGAPLHGAASAGTQGYASADNNGEKK
jgi:hypothetical protein